jgi:hypothetical protein
MLPLPHFLPTFQRGMGAKGKRSLPPFPHNGRLNGPHGEILRYYLPSPQQFTPCVLHPK